MQNTHKPVKKQIRRKLGTMQIAAIVVASLIALCCLAFGGYLLNEHLEHERALRNYPVAYTEFIKASAAEFNLDPYLVQSIMRCESSNDPSAVSDAGAIGLMQIMPDTGTWIAHKLDLDSVYTEDMLFEPETNIRFSCWYLNFLSDRFNGNIMEMIAAYNAGHGSVEDWLKDPRFSQDGTLTSIPFEQTARYYDKVIAAYENYTTLYPELFSADGSAVEAG